MKLRNKKTGEIKEFALFDGNELQGGATLESLTKEWEDYEEPKEYWCIDWTEPGIYRTKYEDKMDEFNKSIGNYFETKEEAEKAVERLRAWERLKDKGFRFIPEASYMEEQPIETGESMMFIACTMNDCHDFAYGDNADIKLLFGGEK